MFLHEAPYLPLTNHSAQLRAAAVKAQCKVDILGTTSDYASKLRAFWDDQKERVENDSGLPSDGVYLGPGNTDFRPLAYLVVSYLRLSKDTAKVAAFKDFCTAMSVAACTTADVTEPEPDIASETAADGTGKNGI